MVSFPRRLNLQGEDQLALFESGKEGPMSPVVQASSVVQAFGQRFDRTFHQIPSISPANQRLKFMNPFFESLLPFQTEIKDVASQIDQNIF